MLRTILLASLFSLSGCVVLNTTYITETNSVSTESTTSTSTVTTTVERKEVTQLPPKVIINVPATASTVAASKCAAFELPAVEPVPETPVFAGRAVEETVDSDAELAGYIKLLKAHYLEERERLEQAHQKWKDACS